MRKREHFGLCRISFTRNGVTVPGMGGYPTMQGAIEALDPFNARPLLHIEAPYVQRYISGKL